jgi:hypothetical protein
MKDLIKYAVFVANNLLPPKKKPPHQRHDEFGGFGISKKTYDQPKQLETVNHVMSTGTLPTQTENLKTKSGLSS